MSIAFQKARPVWLEGRRDTWNQVAGLYTSLEVAETDTPVVLRITGADAYRIWVNGEHAGYGPARTALGYARVDEWPLNDWLESGENHLAIEVLSHGVDSYVFVLQEPFVQAEVLAGNQVLASTPDGFEARVLPERVQKVERFSKQRPFAEAYNLTAGCDAWRLGQAGPGALSCEIVEERQLLPRHVLLPCFDRVAAGSVVAAGRVVVREEPPDLPMAGLRRAIGKRVRGYTVDELEVDISAVLNELEFVEEDAAGQGLARSVPASGHALYDFGRVEGGFVGIRLRCHEATRVYLVFDEVRGREFGLGVGAIALDLSEGEHTFESIEPYSLRFLRVVTFESEIKVESVWVRQYVCSDSDAARYGGTDGVLDQIFEAGRQTFKTNSVDLFTDCPSRERGGYPCDAWFTARAERVLTGESRVERNFLENYFLPEEFDGIPAGMVPHCYPSSRLGNGAYIPNWAMWLVLQLVDYCERTGDQALQELARPRVEALMDWFKPHQNETGLLEDLPGWIFVDWSPSNNYTEGVNHPTNMLYAMTLEAVARLYDRSEWSDDAARVRAAVMKESWDGRWFADQSLRVDGVLQKSEARTETCQYHAFWTGLVDRDQVGDLWPRLRDRWGPCRGSRMVPVGGMSTWKWVYDEGVVPQEGDKELETAGLLFGILLRFDLLHEYGEDELLLEEVRTLLGPQAEQTGSLWEHATNFSSCNHGFASCACDYILAAGDEA